MLTIEVSGTGASPSSLTECYVESCSQHYSVPKQPFQTGLSLKSKLTQILILLTKAKLRECIFLLYQVESRTTTCQQNKSFIHHDIRKYFEYHTVVTRRIKD